MTTFASTSHRVEESTPEEYNTMIRFQTEQRVRLYEGATREEINERLRELDEEWDIERRLMANASTLVVAGVVLSLTVNRGFIVLPGLVGGFLLQHALQGWCPPVSLFRRLGARTPREIEEERTALKVLRGDFDYLEAGAVSGDVALVVARM